MKKMKQFVAMFASLFGLKGPVNNVKRCAPKEHSPNPSQSSEACWCNQARHGISRAPRKFITSGISETGHKFAVFECMDPGCREFVAITKDNRTGGDRILFRGRHFSPRPNSRPAAAIRLAHGGFQIASIVNKAMRAATVFLLTAAAISSTALALTVTVTSPNGGEKWTAGSTYNVTWTLGGSTTAVNYQLVAFSTNGGTTFSTISAALTPSARSFAWTIPSTTSGSQCLIRVRALDVNTYILAQDTSDATFTVTAAAPTVTVTSPIGGENWTAGNTYNVTWTVGGNTTNIHYQLVALSTDGGATFNTISVALTPGTRSFSWTIPTNNYCKISLR